MGPPPPEPPPPPPPSPITEARALWVNRFEYDSPAKIAEIMQKAASANFNIVYFQVRGQGNAYWRSDLEPCAAAVCGTLGGSPMRYDPLQEALNAAAPHGIEVHAWINALTGASPAGCEMNVATPSGSPPHMLRAHPEWVMVKSDGTPMACANSSAYEYVYVSPGIPAARTHLARVAAEIVRRYPGVKGIHLDRIRYPGPEFSYDAVSLASFGKSPSSDPAGWDQFRREQVNLAVREVHDSIQAVRREAVLSAAVWGIYDDRWGWNSSRGVSQYFQDPRAWAVGGYLDVAVPMTYYKTNAVYCGFADWACLLDDHMQRYASSGRAVYIAVTAGRLSGEGAVEVQQRVLSQIELGRRKGVKGFAVYSYNGAVQNGLFEVLAAGVFKEKATVPAMPWK